MQDEMNMAHRNARPVFGDVRIYLGHVLTYPGVAWGYMLAGDRLEVDPTAAESRAAERKLETRYWTPELHAGAFGLPAIVRDALADGPPPNPFKPA
jgi:spermidine synthase